SVNTRNARAWLASTTISRRTGAIVALWTAAIDIVHSSLMWFFDAAFQVCQRFLPKAVEIIAHLGDALRLDAVEVARADRFMRYEARIAQRAQMLRDRRARDRQRFGDLADGARSVGEHLKDRAPHRVAQQGH